MMNTILLLAHSSLMLLVSHNRAITKTLMAKGLFIISFDHGLLLQWRPTSYPAEAQAPPEFSAIFHSLSGKFLANMLT